jgi:GTPase
MDTNETIQSGFICIIGSPNVGKSTLVNALVGQKVAIVSKRPQTTRHRIMGILNEENMQMIFIDTPGLHEPRTKLGEFMLRAANEALEDVDAAILVIDALKGVGQRDKGILEKLKPSGIPVIIAVNKSDIANREQMLSTLSALQKYDWIKEVYPISALKGNGIGLLKSSLKQYLTEGPRYFPEDMASDQQEKMIAAEIVREKILMLLEEEIPHGVCIDIEKMEQRDNGIIDISAVIICEKASHKGIIIGKQGSMLKQVGSLAREELEKHFGDKVFLQMFVKTEEDWRNRPGILREMGYE